ncbi:MAG: hypothetical protein JWM99_2891, partial [Verrucomicrobiales bacterium]|nr:hypothetical protein [Verrucomicrobiales bacterium]
MRFDRKKILTLLKEASFSGAHIFSKALNNIFYTDTSGNLGEFYNSSTGVRGVNGPVHAFYDYNGNLWIGGAFTTAGGLSDFWNLTIYSHLFGWAYTCYWQPLKADTSSGAVTTVGP